MDKIAKTGIAPETLEHIVTALRQHGVTAALLFGSRARGDYNDRSDIDIAVFGEVEDGKLWVALEDLPTIHKIDVVYFSQLTNEALKANIQRDGVPLF